MLSESVVVPAERSRRTMLSALLPAAAGLVLPVRLGLVRRWGESITPIAWSDLPTGSGTWSGTPTVSGLLTASAGITTSKDGATISASSITGTNNTYLTITNTSGALIAGVESSVGGTLFVGTSAYSVVYGTAQARTLHLATNNNARVNILSTGEVDILAGPLIIGTDPGNPGWPSGSPLLRVGGSSCQ